VTVVDDVAEDGKTVIVVSDDKTAAQKVKALVKKNARSWSSWPRLSRCWPWAVWSEVVRWWRTLPRPRSSKRSED